MPLRPTLRIIVGVLATLLATGTAVVLAAGSPSKGSARAAAPRTMNVACAHGGGGKLQYLPDGTKRCGGDVLHFPRDAPVVACQLDKPNMVKLRGRVKLAPPAHKHNVPGMLFVVSGGAKCKPPKYPDSHAVTLPRPIRDLKLCAGKRRGTVRVVLKFDACNDREFRVILKHHQTAAPNHRPVANGDTGLTDKEHPTTISVLANDADADGDALHVTSLDTTGTKGNVTIKPGGKIAYDPNGKFGSLGPSDSAHDKFKYRASDGKANSNAATVDVTVTGVNHAPVLSGVETTALAYDTGTPATPVSPGIAISDAEGGNLSSATVAIASGHVDPNDSLSVTPPSGITSSYDSSTGVLTLTGSAPISDYETALRAVAFSATDPTPSGTRTIGFQVDDGNPLNHASNVASRNVDVTNQPDPPSDLSLSPNSVAENLPTGSTVGVLSTTDPDPGDTFTYALVTGTGDDDNAKFQISGSTLETNAIFDREAKSSYSIRVRTTDSQGNTFEKQLTVTVDDANDAPTDLALSSASVDENQPSGTSVGTLSSTDQDASDPHTYSLVSGTGSTDNGSFQISGSTLKTAAPLDFEAGGTRSIRVKTDDGHGGSFEKVLTITVNDKNDAPTNIGLSNSSVAENQPSGTNVGTLSSTDQDSGDTHSYSLATGTSDDDNGSFQISGSTLQTNATFDRETKSSYSIRVKTDDGNGGTFEKALTITVSDVNEAPTDIALSDSSVAENSPLATTVGTFSTTDPETGDAQIYSLVTGTGDTDNASFTIGGSALQTNTLIDFETKSSYSIRVKTDDGHGHSFEKQFTITVADANDAPTDLALSNASVNENEASGTTVGTLSSTDQDASDTHTYTLVAGTGSTDNGSFQITGSTLQTATPLDFEAGSTRSVRVKTDDGHGGSFEEQLTITVGDVNDAPTGIALSNASVAENQPSGTTVGTFSPTDQDASDTHTYTLVAGTGSSDNASFQISGSTLQTNTIFDRETKSSYSIRVRADDGHGGTFEKVFTISIADVNDAPTDLALSDSSVAENQPVGTSVGTLSTTDQDPADTHTYSLVTGTGDDDNGSFQISGSSLQTNVTFDFEAGSSYSIRVKTDDGHGGSFEKQLTVAVTDANDAPTDIALSNSTIVSDKPTGETVGTLSSTDQDASDTHTYSLVTGTGDDDNASFQIDGSTLKTSTSVPTGTYSVRIRTDDGHGGTFDEVFSVTATPNSTPTDIGLSPSAVDENQPTGTTVGTFTTTDADAGDTFTYTLVSGTGSTDNASFQISGDTLKTNASLDFEAGATRSIRVQTDDGHGGTFEKVFTITVNNKNDAPTDISLSSSSVAENQPTGSSVGGLSTTDQDSADTHTYTFATGTGDDDNGAFQISGSTLLAGQSFDFETKSTYKIRLKTDDGNGGTFEKQFTITVTDANDAPTDLALSPSSVPENSALGTTVGNLSSTDQDTADTHSYTLVAGTGSDDNASFTINGTAVQTNALLDFETKASYKIRVQTDDGHGGTFEKQLTIAVTDVNDAPTNIGLSSASVAENQPSGTTVGTLSTTDQDSGDTHTYSLVTGTGDDDNASFQISGATLQTNASFDFETKSSYKIRVKTDDGHGGTFEKQFTIAITDANDAPTDIGLSATAVDENQPINTVIGNFSTTDQDVGQSYTYTLVSGTGSTDNAMFNISGGSLRTSASFNFEVKNSYSIRVRTTDNGSPNLSYEKVFTITINDVNDAPTTVQDDYSGAIGNTKAQVGTSSSGPVVTLSGNIPIANDSDEDQTFPHTVSTVAETVSSTGGGTATINADGSFTYLPGVGDKNLSNDTFTYHATDGSLTSAGTATVDIVNELVWYVQAGAGGDGRSNAPLSTLASLQGAGGAGDSDTSGDHIFIYGSGTYTGGVPLEANQQLLSQAFGLTVNNGVADQNLVAATGGTASNNPTIQNASGDAIQLANGSDVERVNVGTSSGVGVKGASVTTSTVGGTTTISGASGGALSLTGAAGGNISIGSTITNTANKSVTIQNRSSGTVSLTGNVTDSGTGITLSSNNGATIDFSGTLALTTGSNTAFAASGPGPAASTGGTVTASNTGNTITTTTGRGLDLSNTTIGGGGLAFKSISVNGAANGISLSNTGTTGGLTVSGTGAADSGGTIQNTTGDGVALSSTKAIVLNELQISSSTDNAVDATSVNGLTLDSVDIATTGNQGIRGNGITDFKFRNGSAMTGAGNGANESGIDITDLFGSAAITGSSVTGSQTQNVHVLNNASTPGTLTINGSTFDTTSVANGSDGVQAETTGNGDLTVKLTGDNNLDTTQGDGFQGSSNGSSTMNITVDGTGSNYNDNLGSAVNLAAANSSTMKALVKNFTNVRTGTSAANGLNVINIQNFDTTTLNATVQNVDIAGRGNNASGIRIIQEGNGTLNANLKDNDNIEGMAANGIVAQARAGTGGNGKLNLTIDNNTVNLASGVALDGVSIESGSSAGGDTNTVCLNMLDNTSSSAGAGPQSGYRLRQRTGTTFNLQNFAGSGSSAADVTTWVNSTKGNTGTTDIVIGTAFSNAPSNCTTATLPPP